MANVMLLVGTKKGAFILRSDEARKDWQVSGPLCDHWPMSHVNYDPATGTILAAGGDAWFGHAIWRSPDLGATWTHSSAGLENAEGEPPVTAVWNVTPAHGSLYVGTDPGGLFRSDDGGETWSELKGLRTAPAREMWNPGGAGLILHTIVPHPTDKARMWVAISSAGVYATEDGGETWMPRNHGTRAGFLPEEIRENPVAGQCCHRLVMPKTDSGFLFQQSHEGVYRSSDGGVTWTEVTAGLPSEFGFAVAAHPRDSRTFFNIPLTDPFSGRYMPNGEAAVWKTTDAGDTWQKLTNGLPQENAYMAVLRGAMSTDTLDKAGVYFGTSSGQLWGSADEGDSWRQIAGFLPAISSVEAVVLS